MTVKQAIKNNHHRIICPFVLAVLFLAFQADESYGQPVFQ
jgi:hypothetical protein